MPNISSLVDNIIGAARRYKKNQRHGGGRYGKIFTTNQLIDEIAETLLLARNADYQYLFRACDVGPVAEELATLIENSTPERIPLKGRKK